MNKLIIANQKNYLTYEEVKRFLEDIRGKIPKNQIIFCSSTPYLIEFQKEGYLISSQDISSQNQIMTGEVTGNLLSSLSVSYTLIGHMERRRKESKNEILLKIKNAIQFQIRPIVCVGEIENTSFDFVKKDLIEIFDHLLEEEREKVWIAYEPLEAIGTKMTLNVKAIEQKMMDIKTLLLKEYHQSPKLFYGGSVSKENIQSLFKINHLDGVLIGKASCLSSEFLKIIEVAVTM